MRGVTSNFSFEILEHYRFSRYTALTHIYIKSSLNAAITILISDCMPKYGTGINEVNYRFRFSHYIVENVLTDIKNQSVL